MRPLSCFVALVLVFALSGEPGFAAEPMPSDGVRIDRIAKLCKAWGAVRFARTQHQDLSQAGDSLLCT